MQPSVAAPPPTAALEFHSSRATTLLVAGGCATIAAFIAAAALLAPATWAWLVVAYFGAMAVAVFWNGMLRPATLRLDAQGVGFAHWRHRWCVAWGDIYEVRLMVLRINGFTSHRHVVLLDRFGAKHSIASGLTIPPAALADLIRSRSALASIGTAPIKG